MTAKNAPGAKGRTRAPRCLVCRGASKPGHDHTDQHRNALRVRENRRYQTGPAHEKRIFHIASRDREDAYYAELAEQERAEAITWLIANGPLPDEPTVTYDGSMAQITLKEAGRRLGVSDITLRSAIRRGRMQARKLGRDWLVEESEVRYYELTSLGRVGWPKGRSRKTA